VGVTVIVAAMGASLLLIAVNAGTLVLPEPVNPIEVAELTQV
jgi:hypothetical protein